MIRSSFALALSLALLATANVASAQIPVVSAQVSCGNAESPEGQDYQDGSLTALATASSSDPQFGTAQGTAKAFGPDLNFHGTASAFMGPAWITTGNGTFHDTFYYTFPVSSVAGSTDDLGVFLEVYMSWNIQANGNYSFTLNGKSSDWSLASGFFNNDFALSGSSGSKLVNVQVPLDSVVINPSNPAEYIASYQIDMSAGGGSGSGDFSNGSFGAASADITMRLYDMTFVDNSGGGGGTPIPGDLDSESGLNYENLPFENADFDSDGDVDGADLVIWQRGYPKASAALRSQGNSNVGFDGDVDSGDLAAWEGQFGFDVNALALPVAAAAPEPASCLLAASAILLARRPRRAGRS